MHLDGMLADLEFFGNVAVALALVDHRQQLTLPFGQFFRRGAGLRFLLAVQKDAQHAGNLDRARRSWDIGVRTRLDGPVFELMRLRRRLDGRQAVQLVDLNRAVQGCIRMTSASRIREWSSLRKMCTASDACDIYSHKESLPNVSGMTFFNL